MKLITLPRRRLELVAGPALELELGGARRWPLVKPVSADYMRTVGKPPVDLTAEMLATVAAVYDPLVEAAPLKFDHVAKGPAQGWVRRADFEDGVLWIEPVVFEELRQGIESGRWGRLSAEICFEHPETKTPYLCGVAVLGAASPAVKSLPFRERGGELPPLIHLEAERYRAALDPTNAAKEHPMAETPHETEDHPPAAEPRRVEPRRDEPRRDEPPAADLGSPADPPPATPDPAGTLELHQSVATLRGQVAEQTRRLAELQLSQTRVRVASRLDQLADRLPFAARRLLEPVLVELTARPPQAIELSHGGEDVEMPLGEAVLLALEQLPERSAQLGVELAALDDPEAPRARDSRDAEQRQVDARLGIDDEAALELQAKYPTSFTH